MLIVSEETCKAVVGRSDAFAAVEKVFSAMASGDAYNLPVIREAIGHADALYGFKSGFDRAGLVLGVKSDGYWPGNMDKGLTNHQSTVFPLDPGTGQLQALVGGNCRDHAVRRNRCRASGSRGGIGFSQAGGRGRPGAANPALTDGRK